MYHVFLGALGSTFPTILASVWTRPAIAALQVMLFVAVTFRLARSVGHLDRGLSRAVVVGLLCAPFAVLNNTELLSESISLSITCVLVASACPVATSHAGRLGNPSAVLACFALLAMTRTAHLPVAVGASGAIILLLLASAAQRKVSRREQSVGLISAGIGLAAWLVILAPQAWLMWWHDKLVPGDSALWGVADGQLLWSQQMGKYATVVANCPGVVAAAAPYPVPFIDTVSATGKLNWYLKYPHLLLWHLFQALNWDFPTTYISTFNSLMTVPLNAVSIGIVVVGFTTLTTVGPSLVRHLVIKAPVLGIVLAAIGSLWLQTAFTAVETRFGIIPWSALSVAAVWGASRWSNCWQNGTTSWLPVIGVASATSILVVMSRLAVASVPVFQLYEEAGCDGYRQLTSLSMQSTSHAIRYQLPFPRRINDRMRVKLVLERPYMGSANLHIDVSGLATGVMTMPQGRADEREFVFDQTLFHMNRAATVTITSDEIDPDLRIGARRHAFGRNILEQPEFITEDRVFAGLPDPLTGRMTVEWWPMVWITRVE